MRLEYDATLDEMVDASLRLATSTPTFRTRRRAMVWLAGSFLPAVLFVNMVRRANERGMDISLLRWAIAAVVLALVAAVFAYWIGRYYDWGVRRNYRRTLADLFGGTSAVRCEVELREQGVWTAFRGTETLYSWASVSDVADTGEAIELRFTPGLVVLPNRLFGDSSERARFLAHARELSAKAASSTIRRS